MRAYLLLDIVTIILALIGIGMFYGDLFWGGFNYLAFLYFVILAIGYMWAIHHLHGKSKEIMKKLADRLGCEFEDTGSFSLTHYIRCQDMEIKITLRGSYTPASIHIKISGEFEEALFKGRDEHSRRLTSLLRGLEGHYGIRVNDAYTSSNKAEIIITRYPEDPKVLEEIIHGIISAFTE